LCKWRSGLRFFDTNHFGAILNLKSKATTLQAQPIRVSTSDRRYWSSRYRESRCHIENLLVASDTFNSDFLRQPQTIQISPSYCKDWWYPTKLSPWDNSAF